MSSAAVVIGALRVKANTVILNAQKYWYFWTGFSKNLSFKIAMSGRVGVECCPKWLNYFG